MPEWLIWENVNIANGGTPGSGAAMQATMGGLNRAIPGIGFIPALERGGAASALFGTTTYLGGGDTVDVLISMGIPFAFQGIGLTKQAWANYKNKDAMIAAIKEKAPALKNRPNVEIEKGIYDLLGNVPKQVATGRLLSPQQMRQQMLTKKPILEAMPENIKAYMQRQQYDKLLERANAGDKKAVSELNDYIQGRNIPTYEKLLERVYKGDASAVEQIQMGRYKGGERQPASELKLPPATAAEYKPKTQFDRMREAAPILANDMRPAEKIDPKDLSKARERGFITSAKEVLPELKIEGQYIPRSTDRLAIKARNLVHDNLAQAEKVALKGTSDKSVAVASELIKYYGEQAAKSTNPVIRDAFYQKAANITNDMAHKLTEAGRSVQAASILGRLTPEGQVRFAAREIQRYNEKVAKTKGGERKKIPELTPDQTEYIMKEMKAIERMVEGKERFMRFQKLQKYVSELVPTPLYDKIITTWKAGLLTGVKTTGLNIYSNAAHLGTETVKDIPASAVDKVVGYFTGQRTVTPNIKGLGKGSIEGAGKGLEYLRTGYSERDIGVKLDYHRVNMGKGPLAKGLQAYTETVFRGLGTQGQPFYYAAKLRSLEQQAKASAMSAGLKGKAAQAHVENLMQNPTEKMIKYATKDAEASIFINNTTLGDIARGIQRLPGGEVVVPFGRTPAAVATQIINYSPVGIGKTIIENIGKGRFDQREFSQGIGRGLTGTAVMAIGAKLFDMDMVTLDRPTSDRERKLWELEGRQANSVKINGKWRSVNTLGPAGNLLVIGGHFRMAYLEAGSPTEAMAEALMGSAKSFTEQTFLTGVNQFTEALVDPERSASYALGRTLSTVVPTFVADVARAKDDTERRTETIPEQIMARIPGARQTLEPRITALGEEKAPTANPLELMIDPTRPSKEISTPVVDELRRLWDQGWEVSPTMLGDRKGFEPLTQKENTELWVRSGSLVRSGLEQLVTAAAYTELPDEIKADYISKIISEAQKAAKIEMVARKLSGLEGEELTRMIFELRKSGVADQDIIPIALSRRNPRKVIREQKQ